MVYSRGSIECNAALKEYVKEPNDQEAVHDQLRAGVTIITIGAAATGWPNGPAYIHLSSWEDKLSRMFCNAKRASGSGADAIFLHNNSPYPKTFDSHNFQAGTSQFLSVIMIANNCSSFRQLWELGQKSKSQNTASESVMGFDSVRNSIMSCFGCVTSDVGGGGIIIPENVDKLVDAMISITNGQKHLWDTEETLKTARTIPSKEDAKEILKSSFDDEKIIVQIVERYSKREIE